MDFAQDCSTQLTIGHRTSDLAGTDEPDRRHVRL
jgi:hypothetical protein